MLGDDDLERYARQIVVPGIGAAGQARICSSRVVVTGDPEGVACTERYARAVGFRTGSHEAGPVACVLVAGASALDRRSPDSLLGLHCPTLWYELSPTGIRTGVIPPGSNSGEEEPQRPAGPPSGDPLLHQLAAADLVASAVGVVLDWRDTETGYHLEIG